MYKITGIFFRTSFWIAIILTLSQIASAQCPPPSGLNTFANPFDLGTLGVGSPFNSSGRNQTADCYTDNYTGANNQAANDAFYKITTGSCTDRLDVSTCGMITNFDTYLHVLDAAGTELLSNDNGTCTPSGASSISMTVTPNTVYYIVIEGAGTAEGVFDLNIQEFDDVVFTVTPLATPSAICVGGSSALTATSSNGAAPVTYAWAGLTNMNTHSGIDGLDGFHARSGGFPHAGAGGLNDVS